jgi:phosphatidate cytidylyltransferase
VNSATTRVLSALVLIPLLVALIWFSTDRLFELVLTLVLALAASELKKLVDSWAAAIALMVIYLGAPLFMMADIRMGYGPGALMMLIAIIIVSDSAQYYTGRAFGKHKLAPVISPKKTVEGAVGGLVIGSLAAVGFGRLWPVGLSDLAMFATGFAIAVAGILGDLFESALKRRAGMKDSGNLIPGHGGILDRIDSWLFAAPVFWLILRLTR